jgi:hypothetical protein
LVRFIGSCSDGPLAKMMSIGLHNGFHGINS